MTIVCNGGKVPDGGNDVLCNELDLHGRNLDQLPENIVKNALTLKTLDLSNNSLGHNDEHDEVLWSGLRGLVGLNLSANEFKSWPKFLTGFPCLQMLSICGNEVETLPESLQEYSNLRRLHADFNHLKKIPLDWTALSNLTTLSLSNNRLEDIPPSVWSLPCLTSLDLRRNKITQIGISPLKIVKRLSELKLSYNIIRGCVDLSPLSNLEYLDVSHNTIQLLEISTLEKLIQLDCSYNNLKMLKLHATILRSLIATNNDLDAMFCNHSPSSLEVIDVSHNSMSELPCWILLCKKLRNFSIHHNLLSKIIDGLLCSSTNCLEIVRINHNLLNKLPDSVSSCSVRNFYLQYNRLNSLPDNFFAKFSNLETLNISYNYLQRLPTASKCPELKVVIASGNQFEDVSSLESLFKLPSLRKLHLSNNNIKDIPDNFFSNCSSLEDLSLACNHLKKIPTLVTKATNLRKLYLHSNELKCLPSLMKLPELQVLDAACNDLNEMGLCSIAPKSLIYLDLSANTNIHIDPMEFQNLCCHRSVAVVDVNSAGIVTRKSNPTSNNSQDKIPWCLGFTETEKGNTRLYVELQKDNSSSGQEALLALLEADSDFLASHLRQAFPAFLKVERECEESSPHYLRNVLLSCARFLRARGQCSHFGITLCHLSSQGTGSPVTLNLGTIGRPSSCILGRAGNVIVLSQREDNVPIDIGEWRQAINNSSFTCNNQFSGNSCKTLPKGLWGSIPNPEIREIVLSPQDKFLVFGCSDFSNILPAEQVCRIVQSSNTSVAAAKFLSEEYSAVSSSNRECVAVVTFQTQEPDEVEKYRCWEFMLEQNHKLLFTKELETIHKTILRDPGQRVIGDPTAWYNSAFLKYKCPLPSHRGRYYCYGSKLE